MARTHGTYSTSVPLYTTWEESITLIDGNGDPVDLTGYDVRCQLRPEAPVIDPDTGDPVTDPLLEFTTAGYYGVAPDWPVFEAWSVPTPADGTMLLLAEATDYSPLVAPTNERTTLVWDIKLVNGDGYVIPVVAGRVSFLPAVTV